MQHTTTVSKPSYWSNYCSPSCMPICPSYMPISQSGSKTNKKVIASKCTLFVAQRTHACCPSLIDNMNQPTIEQLLAMYVPHWCQQLHHCQDHSLWKPAVSAIVMPTKSLLSVDNEYNMDKDKDKTKKKTVTLSSWLMNSRRLQRRIPIQPLSKRPCQF